MKYHDVCELEPAISYERSNKLAHIILTKVDVEVHRRSNFNVGGHSGGCRQKIGIVEGFK